MTTIDTQTRREVRITMPTGDYQVIVMQGIARAVERLMHGETGTTRRTVWQRGSIPGKGMVTVLKLAGFGSTGDPSPPRDVR